MDSSLGGNVENTPELRRRIKAAQAYAEMSLDTFADEVGFGRQTLVRIRSGERPTVKQMELRQIADVTGLPVAFFTMDFALAAEQPTVNERLAALEDQITRLAAERGAPAPPGELGRRAGVSQPSDVSQRPSDSERVEGQSRGAEG